LLYEKHEAAAAAAAAAKAGDFLILVPAENNISRKRGFQF